jgi:hypothetical protein
MMTFRSVRRREAIGIYQGLGLVARRRVGGGEHEVGTEERDEI